MSKLWEDSDLTLSQDGGSYILSWRFLQGNATAEFTKDGLIWAAINVWVRLPPPSSLSAMTHFILGHFPEEEIAMAVLEDL
jgi:hypothetical protein